MQHTSQVRVAWDTSFAQVIVCLGTEFHLLKDLELVTISGYFEGFIPMEQVFVIKKEPVLQA